MLNKCLVEKITFDLEITDKELVSNITVLKHIVKYLLKICGSYPYFLIKCIFFKRHTTYMF